MSLTHGPFHGRGAGHPRRLIWEGPETYLSHRAVQGRVGTDTSCLAFSAPWGVSVIQCLVLSTDEWVQCAWALPLPAGDLGQIAEVIGEVGIRRHPSHRKLDEIPPPKCHEAGKTSREARLGQVHTRDTGVPCSSAGCPGESSEGPLTNL